ncbi:vesicular transport factor [Populus alba x Populus x berolinensis]|nr:vesicular transport factor [Populus alba x Populus x berolinensis]
MNCTSSRFFFFKNYMYICVCVFVRECVCVHTYTRVHTHFILNSKLDILNFDELQVEEEMLMRKFYDLMAAQGLSKKKEGSNNVSDGGRTGQSTASLPNTVDISDGGIDRHSSAIVPFTATDEQM